MTTFERTRKRYMLDFTGTSLEGLEIVAAGMSMGQALDSLELADIAEIKGVPTPEQRNKIREVLMLFVSKIESWNLTKDGQPVPITVEELMSWDAGEAMQAVSAWQAAIMDVDAGKEQPSNGGSKWVGAPIPMDIPSPSLPN